MMLPSFLANLDPSIYFSDNYVVADFETDTSHGDYGHPVHPDNRLLLACWKLGPAHPHKRYHGTVWARWGDEYQQEVLIEAIAHADFVVAHQAKYELGWLKRMKADLYRMLPFDTKLAEYVLLGNLAAGSEELGMRPRSTSLDECCRRRGFPIKDPAVDMMIKHGINPVAIPKAWLEGRCRQDVQTTEDVFLSQREVLRDRGLLPVLYTRCLLTPVLAAMEQEGLAVDGAALETEYEKYFREYQICQGEMDVLTGGINSRSPVQMAEFIYDKLGFKELTNKRGEPKRNKASKSFPAGAPKTDNKTLEKLKATNKKQRAFLALRKKLGRAQAILSKNLEFFRGVRDEHNGIFYGEIQQTNTATHRTASRGMPMVFQSQVDDRGQPKTRTVQFQNFPRVLKHLIVPKRKGWLFVDPDGAQIEFRCAAVLGKDEQAMADIINPEFDAHVQTASILHNCSKEEVLAEKKQAAADGRDDWRQLAKPDTYKPLYGGRFGTPEQERYYKWFREHYSGISRAQQEWVDEAVEFKRQTTPWGLVYWWPFAKRDKRGRVNCETAVNNYPIQALATAEIVPIAAVYMWHRIHEAGLDAKVALVNMVHDSVPCEVHPKAIKKVTAIIKQAFTHDVYNYLAKVYKFEWDSRVPLGVGVKVGESWGTGKENSWDIYVDGREVQRK